MTFRLNYLLLLAALLICVGCGAGPTTSNQSLPSTTTTAGNGSGTPAPSPAPAPTPVPTPTPAPVPTPAPSQTADFVYIKVQRDAQGTIAGYSVDGSGNVTAVEGASLAVGNSDTFAQSKNMIVSNDVWGSQSKLEVLKPDPHSGVLAVTSELDYPILRGTPLIDATGSFVYDFDWQQMSIFKMDGSGRLQEFVVSPFNFGDGPAPLMIPNFGEIDSDLLSSDGKTMVAAVRVFYPDGTGYSESLVFARDPVSGLLTKTVGKMPQSSVAIATSNGYLITSGMTKTKVYRFSASGMPKKVSDMSQPVAMMTASADGRFVYGAGTTDLYAFELDGKTGKLKQVALGKAGNSILSMAESATGNYLFMGTADFQRAQYRLEVYRSARANEPLAYVGSLDLAGWPEQLAVFEKQ